MLCKKSQFINIINKFIYLLDSYVFMEEEKPKKPHQDFVEAMLKSAKEKKEESDPMKPTDADPKEVEELLKGIREKIQKKEL